MTRSTFDEVMAAGRAAVLSGEHHAEAAPAETGRWGPSVVFLPSGGLAASLDRLTHEAAAVLPGHWHSGATGAAHVTVRALEPYADGSLGSDRAVRYRAALASAADGLGAVQLNFEGLVLSVGTVMAWATNPDGRADELRRRFAAELGADGWLEDTAFKTGRDPIWYSSLLHFAGPIESPANAVEWVDARRDTAIGEQSFESAALCRWEFDARCMLPSIIGAVPLT